LEGDLSQLKSRTEKVSREGKSEPTKTLSPKTWETVSSEIQEGAKGRRDWVKPGEGKWTRKSKMQTVVGWIPESAKKGGKGRNFCSGGKRRGKEGKGGCRMRPDSWQGGLQKSDGRQESVIAPETDGGNEEKNSIPPSELGRVQSIKLAT